jgi:hypothetical protein
VEVDQPRALGRCLCGAVTFRVTGELRDVIDCHCHRCRRFTGHHLAATSAHVGDVEIDDLEGELTWFQPVDEAAYGFCRRCGSSLFWMGTSTPDRMSICAGTLEPPTGLRTVEAWWVSEASDYAGRADLPERQTE